MPRAQQAYPRFLGLSIAAIAALTAMSLLCSIECSSSAVTMTPAPGLSELPLAFPVQSPEIAAYFNQIARPEDIASFPAPFASLLPQATAGQRMVVFVSWTDAERDLEALIGQIDLVMYNPEHWENTPADEQQNLAATVQRAAEFAHARGLRFMFAPDRRFAEEHLSQVAPYVDAILLQGQRLQDAPQAFASWICDMSNIARASNPEAQIYAQVGATRGTASQMFAAIQTVSNDIDGIAVWSTPKSLNILQEFVALIRESPPVIQATLTSTSPPTLATALPIATCVATSTPDETIVETHPPTVSPTRQAQPPQVEQEAQVGVWLKQIVLVVVGMVIGLLLGFGLARRRRGG